MKLLLLKMTIMELKFQLHCPEQKSLSLPPGHRMFLVVGWVDQETDFLVWKRFVFIEDSIEMYVENMIIKRCVSCSNGLSPHCKTLGVISIWKSCHSVLRWQWKGCGVQEAPQTEGHLHGICDWDHHPQGRPTKSSHCTMVCLDKICWKTKWRAFLLGT